MIIDFDSKPELTPVFKIAPDVFTKKPIIIEERKELVKAPVIKTAPDVFTKKPIIIEERKEIVKAPVISSEAIKEVSEKHSFLTPSKSLKPQERSCQCSNKKKYLIFTGLFLGGLIIGKNI
ncbi:hypothetical protein [Pseudotamlana carrageenivorans]|uniref:Uncharacterized protein n=1 Tax=Pseudotamlana carrageenivorans TaxID=2069432 RepID=A0A2I7SES1_9FLAO|nr:hypothetical protein [Tamlana carrageenivorans]AUS04388.1 hypothetical protein C1A40_02375 [Tamlana carrageenivorans]